MTCGVTPGALRKQRSLHICGGNRPASCGVLFPQRNKYRVIPMHDSEEHRLMEELDREVSRNGNLFALVACLAIATGLAVAAALALAPLA